MNAPDVSELCRSGVVEECSEAQCIAHFAAKPASGFCAPPALLKPSDTRVYLGFQAPCTRVPIPAGIGTRCTTRLGGIAKYPYRFAAGTEMRDAVSHTASASRMRRICMSVKQGRQAGILAPNFGCRESGQFVREDDPP